MKSGVRHMTPGQESVARLLGRARYHWLGWWDDPLACRRLLIASGCDPSTGILRAGVTIGSIVALLTGCAAPAVTDPCYPPAIDTVITQHGERWDTLVVSVQLCLTPPPIG